MSHSIVSIFDPSAQRQAIARALLEAPGWARVGLTSSKPALREDAAIELARAVEAAGHADLAHEGAQLALTL